MWELAGELGPWGIFVLVLAKIGFDAWSNKRTRARVKEEIENGGPKDLLDIHPAHVYHALGKVGERQAVMEHMLEVHIEDDKARFENLEGLIKNGPDGSNGSGDSDHPGDSPV